MKETNVRLLVRAALLAALCYVLTRVVTIPTPTGGYVNLGDCAVLLSAWMLGPLYGGLAAGIGSMLADLLSGYGVYAPGTFLVKALMAVTAALLFRLLERRGEVPALVSAAVAGEAVMVAGYFLYESTVLGTGLGAVGAIGANLVQGAVGAVAGSALITTLSHSPLRQLRAA